MTTTSEATVLITNEAGVADYVTDGNVRVVCVDWDAFSISNVAEWMPLDVLDKIDQVKSLPADLPWRADTLKRLQEYLRTVESLPR